LLIVSEEEDTPPASKRKSPRLEAAPQISLAPTGNLALPPAKATVFGSGTFGTSGTPAVSAVAAAAPPTPVAAKAAIIVPPAAPASLPALPAIKKFVSKPHAAVSTSSVPAIQPKIVTATADHAFGQALAFSVYRDMSPPSSNSSGLQSQTACMLENGVFLTVGTWNSELEIRGINLRLLRRNLQAANDELKSEQCAKCHESNVVVDCTSCSLRLCARCDLKLHADEATVAHSRTEVQSASAVEAAKQTPVLLMRPSSRSLNASAYQQIIGNSFGNRALLVGNSELAVLSLPKRRLESENVAEGAELHSVAEIQCAQCPFFADTKTIAQGVTVIQAAWHPLSDSHIVVLCSDRALRVFDIRTWSQANVVEPEQTFSLTAHEASSSDFVGFSFGSDAGMKQLLTGSKETSFIVEAFSIYLLHSNGNLYSLCPVVPRGLYSTSKFSSFLMSKPHLINYFFVQFAFDWATRFLTSRVHLIGAVSAVWTCCRVKRFLSHPDRELVPALLAHAARLGLELYCGIHRYWRHRSHRRPARPAACSAADGKQADFCLSAAAV
jgi:hypothetical protein